MPTNLMRGTIAVLCMLIWGAFVILTVLGYSQLDATQFNLLLVALAAVTGPVLQFLFGGSQSSDRKTELLAHAPPTPSSAPAAPPAKE